MTLKYYLRYRRSPLSFLVRGEETKKKGDLLAGNH